MPPVSWNVGALYRLFPGVSPYVGVSNSYLSNFNSENIQTGIGPPESALQYEARVKFSLLNDRFALNTAVFAMTSPPHHGGRWVIPERPSLHGEPVVDLQVFHRRCAWFDRGRGRQLPRHELQRHHERKLDTFLRDRKCPALVTPPG